MNYGFQSVIMTEDDLTISVDFFDYFDAMHNVLIKDPTLFCVSAWNDNGKKELINSKKAGLNKKKSIWLQLPFKMFLL